MLKLIFHGEHVLQHILSKDCRFFIKKDFFFVQWILYIILENDTIG
jgi:hypothetical protein